MNMSKNEYGGKRILIIIPALNEEDSIGAIVFKIKTAFPQFEVLVINDGSSDKTAERARMMGSQVISLPQNLGIGGAVQTGYRYAYQNRFDIAVQVDADGQHRPEELLKILRPILQGEADMVVGSRFVEKTGYHSSTSRRTGIYILSAIVSWIAKQPIKDVTSGFRAINRQGIELFVRDYSTDYPEVDSLVLAKKHGLRIKEVPVEMDQRMAGHSSITATRSLYYMLKVTLTLWKRA